MAFAAPPAISFFGDAEGVTHISGDRTDTLAPRIHAGELSDPHGTHRLCAEAIFEAVRQVRAKDQHFDVWPYSPDVIERKKQAIFRHQSQKDKAMFPGGADRRKFWQRAEDRNIGTAKTFDLLGLPEYYALEAFVKWDE